MGVIRGMHFIMETAAITDAIMNSLAMSFFLSIPQLVFGALTTKPTKHIVGSLVGWDLFDMKYEEESSSDEILARFEAEELFVGSGRHMKVLKILRIVAPKRLV